MLGRVAGHVSRCLSAGLAMEDRQFTVTLEGGRPWGFSLQGGLEFRSPLRVGKVRKGGKEGKKEKTKGEERPSRGLIHPCASTDMHTLHTVYLVWHLSLYTCMHVCTFSHVNGVSCSASEVTLHDNGRWLWPGILQYMGAR